MTLGLRKGTVNNSVIPCRRGGGQAHVIGWLTNDCYMTFPSSIPRGLEQPCEDCS